MSQTPAGWYPDADGIVRWWDGTRWTEFTQPPSGPPPQGGGRQGWPSGQQGWGTGQYGSGQQGSGQQGWGTGQQGWGTGQPGWPAGQPSYAMSQPRKNGVSPAMWAGLGGGLLALVAVVVVLVLVLGNGNDNKKSPAAAADTSATTTSTPTAAPTPSDTASPSPPDTGTTTGGTGRAASAPKNASVSDFCKSFDLTTFQSMNSGNLSDNLQKLQRLQTKMLAVGTPADIPANARRGWEWFADINPTDPSTALNMNQNDLSALGYYYGTKCY